MVKLEDLVAMEVPKPVLQYIAKKNKIKPGSNATGDYAKALVSSEKTKSTAEQLFNDYRFAGRTAVNIFTPLTGVDRQWDNIEVFHKKLLSKYGDKVFTGLRPQLSEKPQLIQAYKRENSYVLAFSYLGRPRRQLVKYEIVKYKPQLLDYVIIHFNPFSVEIRAPLNKEKLFKAAVLEVMGIKEDKVDWDMITRFSDKEAFMLAQSLKAGLKGAKHQMTEGIYATKEVVAHPNINLYEQEEYKKEFAGKPVKRQTLYFEYEYSFGLKEVISFRIADTGLNFISNVSEEVINHVISVFLNIRAQDIAQNAAK